MASYAWNLLSSGTPIADLAPLNPNLTFRLKDKCEVSFDLNTNHPTAALVEELISDIAAYRDGDFIYRGTVIPSQDRLDAHGAGYVSFTTEDYRGRLGRRYIYDDDASYWFDEDVAVIASEMITWTQARTNGGLGIDTSTGSGMPALGVIRNEFEATPGTAIADALNSLQESKVRGFDWEISPTLELNMWVARGTTSLKRLEYLGNFTDVTRMFKADEFANAVRASGGDQPVPLVEESATIGSDARGRWEKEVSWPDTETQEVMEDRTSYLLEQEYRVPKEYTVVLQEGMWQGRSHIWLGDQVTMAIDYGRLQIEEVVRVHEVQISLPSDKTPQEKVTLVLK